MKKQTRRCIQCRRPDNEVGQLSRRGLCASCGHENYLRNLEAMTARKGPEWELNRRRWRASAGALGRPETEF